MNQRPLSPHLQIYKPQITSVLSILHRFTGVLLSLGAVFMVAWLAVIAFCDHYFAFMQAILHSLIGSIILFSWLFSLFYHFGNGIRHLLWDMGKGVELKTAYFSGYLVVIFAVLLTIITWFII